MSKTPIKNMMNAAQIATGVAGITGGSNLTGILGNSLSGGLAGMANQLSNRGGGQSISNAINTNGLTPTGGFSNMAQTSAQQAQLAALNSGDLPVNGLGSYSSSMSSVGNNTGQIDPMEQSSFNSGTIDKSNMMFGQPVVPGTGFDKTLDPGITENNIDQSGINNAYAGMYNM
tara:strand:- start:1283 stop:1801 length:519 start_codon:yes stop_codon:yes gene_type:complete